MDYLKAFLVGGVICALVQILMEKTKLLPGRIMVILVCTGAVLGALQIYGPFSEWAKAGASVPLLGFGNLLWEGVKKAVDEKGFLLNLDVGTMIHNKEAVEELEGKAAWINHVHISEPGLKLIEQRSLHKELACFLRENAYSGFVSIEMGKQERFEEALMEEIMCYVKEIFG